MLNESNHDARTIAIIPARGGSKSIKLKNITEFLGRPLIEHVIEAAKRSHHIDRIVCSTDNDRIAEVVDRMRVEVLWRPVNLSQDDTPVLAVLQHVLSEVNVHRIDIVPLLQPTSPFVLPGVIDECVGRLKEDLTADAAQTITGIPHNFHAYNQRIVENGYVRFRFEKERLEFHNKQLKPKFYIFGNLVVTRAYTILERGRIFGEKCLAVEIPAPYAVDIDGLEDIPYALFQVQSGRVVLPWL
jgi:CMP-N,N'-diacetyllegionaminic acid synthase